MNIQYKNRIKSPIKVFVLLQIRKNCIKGVFKQHLGNMTVKNLSKKILKPCNYLVSDCTGVMLKLLNIMTPFQLFSRYGNSPPCKKIRNGQENVIHKGYQSQMVRLFLSSLVLPIYRNPALRTTETALCINKKRPKSN